MPLLSPTPTHLTPILPKHAQPTPSARTWWGRNWRPIRFFCVIFFVCWLVGPWVWGVVVWGIEGGGRGGWGDGGRGGGHGHEIGRRRERVVIVGAGPAGISTAVALSKHKDSHGNPLFSITIFEQKSNIGGRMVLDFNQNQDPHSSTPFWRGVGIEDVATSELLPAGSIIRERFEELGGNENELRKKASRGQGKTSVGFFNGKEIIAQVSRPAHDMGWGEWFSLVFRYGASVWRAKNLGDGTEKMIAEVLKAGSLPQHQHRFQHYDPSDSLQPETNLTLHSILATAQLSALISRSAEDFLSKRGISSSYRNEILNPQVRRQIGQDVNEISEFALRGALGMEKAGSRRSGSYGVESFERAMRGLAGESGADVRLGREVVGVRRARKEGEFGDEGRGRWALEIRDVGKTDGETSVEVFDQVVIAAPWNVSALITDSGSNSGSNSGGAREGDGGQNEVFYRSVYVTFIVSNDLLEGKYFGSTDPPPDEILFIGKEDGPQNRNRKLTQKEKELLGIHEISHVRRMYGPDLDLQSFNIKSERETGNMSTDAVYQLYRILSDHPLDTRASAGFLKKIFGNGDAMLAVKSVLVQDAYPLLWPRSEREVGEFRIAEGLWWTGAGEGVGSVVEMAWVVGEVVAGCLEREVLAGGGGRHWGRVERPFVDKSG
ncbi:hypothetical protein DL98DRAFT_649191 [Cadophora sp. DSE1049]|nr:hypothetical protein DL98DRAFT_649191 [Cadophora sp. DSE1049]